jgi:hypothetical protein
MKGQLLNFLYKLGIIVMGILITDYAVKKIGNKFYSSISYATQEGRTYYAIKKAQPEVLILGSSTANHHYATPDIKNVLHYSVYNAGRDGRGLLYHSCIMNSIINKHIPKIIILEIGRDDLFGEWNNRVDVLRPFYYNDSLIRATINGNSKTERIKMLSNMYRYNSILPRLIFAPLQNKQINLDGYTPLIGGENPKPHEIKIVNETRNGPLSQICVDRLNYMIDIANRHHINFIVVLSPNCIKYYGDNQSLNAIKRICEQKKILFIDNSQSEYFFNHSELFIDIYHLSNIGAEIYTKMFLEQIKPVIIE